MKGEIILGRRKYGERGVPLENPELVFKCVLPTMPLKKELHSKNEDQRAPILSNDQRAMDSF